MAEEEIKQEAQQEEETKIKQEPPVVATQKKSYAGLIISIINFILILALIGGGFYLLQEVKDKQVAHGDEFNKDDLREIEVSKQLNAYQNQLASMQKQIANFNTELTGKDDHFTKTLATFSQLHTERLTTAREDLSKDITQVKRQLGKTRGDWLIADAEYLLSIANQRLHLVGDIKTTRLALEAADQRLRESGDSAVYKVREQIIKDVAVLKTVALPDIVGVYSTLQMLSEKVNGLAVLLPYAGKPLTESKQIHDHDQPQGSEHGILNSAIGLLEGYVTVKHSDQPVTEILSEEDVKFLRGRLNVKLEIIEIALVQQNDTLFKRSIADTKQWINKNFTKNPQAKSFQTELDKLDAINIRSQFPDISKSLKMLKDITKLRLESDKAQADSRQEAPIKLKQVIKHIEPAAKSEPIEKPTTDAATDVAPAL